MSKSSEEKLSERLAQMGALAGGMAHELRNPLGNINMTLDLLLEDLGDSETEKARRTRRKLEIMRKEALRLDEMLDNFLKIARGQELSLTMHDLNQVIEDVLDLMAPTLASSNIQIRKGLGPGLPSIMIDLGLVKQALINIIKNGKEAMPDGGELIVRTSQSDEFIQIDIADTGKGIPLTKMEKIFQPYFSTKKVGTGLGLATTKRIIEDHNGDISFTSDEGKGTNFCIRLSLERPQGK